MKKMMIIGDEKNFTRYFQGHQPLLSDTGLALEIVDPGPDLLENEELLGRTKNVIAIVFEMTGDKIPMQGTLDFLEKVAMIDPSKKFLLAIDSEKIDQEGLDRVSSLCKETPRIFAVIDLKLAPEMHLPLFRTLALTRGQNQLENLDTDVLLDLKKEIDHVVLTVEKELMKVKKLHEHIVPKRFSEIKGINILSKYSVGENPGGEFFDIIYKNKKIALILSSSSSYVISGMLLNHFSNLKKERSLDLMELRNFMSNVSKDIGGVPQKNQSGPPIQLLSGIIDLKTLTFEGHNFGNAFILSSSGENISGNQFVLHESFFEKSYFSFKVKRGEKMIVVSPGLRKNCKDFMDGRPIIRYLSKHLGETPFEILNEIFFQLKKDKVSDFLPYDASSIIIEVNKNVLVQA